MSTLVSAFYAVRFEARPPLIRGTVLRPLSADEFTEACEMLLAEARKHRCQFWLLDGRADENNRPPDVYDWLSEEFLPRVRRALDRVPCLAFVAAPCFWSDLQARHYAPPAPHPVSGKFRAYWFVNETEALAWLNRARPAERPTMR